MYQLDHYFKEEWNAAETQPKIFWGFPCQYTYRYIKITSNYFIFLYESNAFSTYKAIQYHLPHRRIFISNSAYKIIKEIHIFTHMYKARVFNIDVYRGDNEFNINVLSEHISSASLNIYAKVRHIPIVERSIQTIYQGSRFSAHSLPYMSYKRLMKISLM